MPFHDLRYLGPLLLQIRNGTPGVEGVTVKAPELERFRIEQVEEEPGQLVLAEEGNQGLAADGVEAIDIEGLQLMRRLVKARHGLVGFANRLLVSNERLPIGTPGLGSQTTSR